MIKKYLSLHPVLKLLLIIVVSLFLLTLAMHFFEHIPIWQSLYFSVITGTTIGYGDISPKTVPGQISVILFALIIISTLGDFITMATSVSADLLRRKREGLLPVKDHTNLLIIGFPDHNKVKEIITEYRKNARHKNDTIVCLNNQLDEQSDWMIDLDITFVKGIASSIEILNLANITNTDKILVLANDPNKISSDDFTSSAVLMCEKLNPSAYTIAERVRNESDLFDICDCDHIVPICSARELAHELLNPGAIDLIQSLFSNDTESTQRNITIATSYSWKEIVIALLTKNCTAIGYCQPDNGNTYDFNFAPKIDDVVKKGAIVKYISTEPITVI